MDKIREARLETVARFLTLLARENVPPHIQEVLCYGDTHFGVKPGALERAIAALPSCEEWIPTTERLPEKPGKSNYEYVECLIFYKGEILMRPWNCEHQVWDDEEHDDFFCVPTAPTHWRPLPSPPER